MVPLTCLVWNLISYILSIRGLETSHAININPDSTKFTRNNLNDLMYTHAKIYIYPKRWSYKFWYWPKRPLLLARSVQPKPLSSYYHEQGSQSLWGRLYLQGLVKLASNLGMDC